MALTVDADGNQTLVGLFVGYVRENEDPERLGRVRVEIPGLIEPMSAWAPPIGGAGGSAKRGVHDVPAVGATVAVFFHAGDEECPYYLGGWPGRGEQLSALSGKSASAAVAVHAWESDRHEVAAEDSGSLTVRDKSAGGKIVIEADQVFVGGETLAEPTLKATTYRQAEDLLIAAITAALAAVEAYATLIQPVADPTKAATPALVTAILTTWPQAVATFATAAAAAPTTNAKVQ